MITFDQFLGHVMKLGSLDAKDAHRATFATIRTLGEVLDEPIAKALRDALPHRMGLMMLANAPKRRPRDFYERASLHEGRSIGTAKEHAEVVCRVLGDVLDEELVLRMGKDLHRADLFEHRPVYVPIPPYGVAAH